MRAQVLSPATLTAYGRSYRAPRAYHFLTFTHLRRRHHLRSPRCWTLSLSRSSDADDISRLLTGFHCPLFRMEGYFFSEILWMWAMLLCLIQFGRALERDSKNSPCLRTLERDSELVNAPPMEATLPKNFFAGGGDSARNKAMVENLRSYGVIWSERVAEIMETLDRGHFVTDGSSAYVDSPMPIGYNATISAPHMHGTCLQLLEQNLKPGMRALDVGSGTGYLTACFALMVGPQGRAVGVEHIPELVEASIKNIENSAASRSLKNGSLSLHVGDGRKGWPEFAPYDAIHVGAAAAEIPRALLDQLKPGGRMVIPVGTYLQDLKVLDKDEDGSIRVHTETSVRYVPLTSRDEQLGGF